MPKERVYRALSLLAGKEKIQKRLYYAADALHPLREENFLDEDHRSLFSSIMSKLTNDGNESFEASTNAMSDSDAERVANDIVRLAFDLASTPTMFAIPQSAFDRIHKYLGGKALKNEVNSDIQIILRFDSDNEVVIKKMHYARDNASSKWRLETPGIVPY